MKRKIAELTEADLINARKKLAAIKKKAETLREEELAIRHFIADVLYPEEDGSKTLKVGNVKLTIKRTLNYSITRDEAERLTQEHGDLALEVLSWSPEVKVRGFKDNVDTVADYITVKAGPPTVVFKD